MPLRTTSTTDPTSLSTVSEEYLIFYSSIVDGRLWCPDCRAVEEDVRNVFDGSDDPPALIVYVGDKSSWKPSSNPFRGAPWNITSIPTIVKVKDGKEIGRLVELEVKPGLAEFIKPQSE
ncbi:hypothetical protein BDN72DRAFT_43697 [Pluteus cervinus]|uniref:Uncharacterized protein n=1 Tax=Pluteus cervinus TaxID=181527 RepID=A0ACD3BHQ3_9AGAR|nr:hypothetical protein BDN72DRAFT_43697 [Pluteus cervinus]